MKLTLKTLWDSSTVLNKLNKLTNVPVKTGWWIMRNTQKIRVENDKSEDKRKEVIEKYGEVGEDKRLSVPDKNMDAFMKEMTEYLDGEIEIDLKYLKLEDLQGLTPEELEKLSFMIKSAEEELK